MIGAALTEDARCGQRGRIDHVRPVGRPMARLVAQDYFRAALTVLADQGSEALTITAVCGTLGVTKGSFYHHFGSLAGFVEQLLPYWESQRSSRLAGRTRPPPDPRRRLGALVDLVVDLPHATEAAMRAWGWRQPDIAAALERVDRRRERHLTEVIAAVGVQRPDARTHARIMLDVLIGTQQREDPVDARRLRQVLVECTR
jgi:AcrR family transcriptional regulator